MRIHLPAPVPHRDPNPAWEPCAFTGKIWRLARLLTGLGHDVFLYGGPDTDPDVATHVQVVSQADRDYWFGDERYDTAVFDRWDPTDRCWTETNGAVVAAIRERIEPADIVCVTAGRCQQAIADAFPNHVVCEPGVGYEAPLRNTHWCVESEAWRHWLYGAYGISDGRWFDTVIPNFFDPDDLAFSADKEPFLLYLGRMTARKGLEVVAGLAKHHVVVTAGPGPDRVPGATHAGVVRGADKAQLLARAQAVIVPTRYVEPFGGVAAEAMLSGTPVITSPFGAFSETVADGISGYRCHTLDQFVRAVYALDDLDPKAVHEWAADRFTMSAVAPQYDRWFGQLGSLYGKGWYA